MRVEVESEVQGSVWKVEVAEGASVSEGDVIMILESMKMEIPVEAPVSGTVVKLSVAPEDAIEDDQVLAVIEGDG